MRGKCLIRTSAASPFHHHIAGVQFFPFGLWDIYDRVAYHVVGEPGSTNTENDRPDDDEAPHGYWRRLKPDLFNPTWTWTRGVRSLSTELGRLSRIYSSPAVEGRGMREGREDYPGLSIGNNCYHRRSNCTGALIADPARSYSIMSLPLHTSTRAPACLSLY